MRILWRNVVLTLLAVPCYMLLVDLLRRLLPHESYTQGFIAGIFLMALSQVLSSWCPLVDRESH